MGGERERKTHYPVTTGGMHPADNHDCSRIQIILTENNNTWAASDTTNTVTHTASFTRDEGGDFRLCIFNTHAALCGPSGLHTSHAHS